VGRERQQEDLNAASPHLATLRGAFARARYTTEAVAEALETATLSGRPADLVVNRRRLAGRHDACATLIRLFLLQLPVDERAVASAVAPLVTDELVESGLVERESSLLRARARVVPHGDVYVVADLDRESSRDYVAGVQGPSVVLAKLTVRRPVRTALDVGTGCGIQALLASAHAARVVATDVNERALTFASAAARLNGVGNVEFRAGDAFEPVSGERFDLIVANPPYVVSPDASYLYRDSGLRGDAISRAFVRGIPEHLEEGGFGHVLVSWIVDPDGDWDEPLRAWIDGSGCDAWLLHHGTDSPIEHAAKWLRPVADEDPGTYERALDRWLAYLAELGADGIASGAVVLRRRSAATNWIRVDEFPAGRLEPAGEHVETVFAAADDVARDGEEGLLAARLALEPRHELHSSLVAVDGALEAREHTLRLAHGIGFGVGLDPNVLPLLPLLDGSRPVRDVLAAAAGAAGVDVPRYSTAALPIVRRLFELGFLVRA
jgi:methylase of polypeptide subunit release factors